MSSPVKEKKENPWVSLIFNIVIPTLILMKLSDVNRLGPVGGLLLALAFPIIYGIYDFLIRKKYNFFSILGFISILLTGGLGLLQLQGIWFAVKEAAVPLIIGIAVIISLKTKTPLIKILFLNKSIINMDLVETKISENENNEQKFKKIITQATYLIALSFLISAILNFLLAILIIKSPPGTPAFNKELGFMTAISYPIILVFCSSILIVAIWKLIKGISRITGLDMESILKTK